MLLFVRTFDVVCVWMERALRLKEIATKWTYEVRDLFECTRAIHRFAHIVFRSFQFSCPVSLPLVTPHWKRNKFKFIPRIVWMQPRQRLPNTICCGTEETAELSRERRMQRIRLLCRPFLIVLHFAMKMVLNFDVVQFMTFLRTFLFVFKMDFDRCRQREDSQNGRKLFGEWIPSEISFDHFRQLSIHFN